MRKSFDSIDEFRGILDDLPGPDSSSLENAARRNDRLTKPAGALGRLEELAVWYASWRRSPRPVIHSTQIIVFAGNHGVAARGVSAYPPEVTRQMVANFGSGGAAINQLAKEIPARLEVVEVDLHRPTEDITGGAAMTERGFVRALKAGWDAVDSGAHLLVPGEMGIGNTTSAAAVALAMFGGSADAWTGAGTGVSNEALDRKRAAVARAVEVNGPFSAAQGLEVLQRLGGREMAAIAGAIARARLHRIPVILDGFICTAAAAALHCESTDALDHAVAGHCSHEAGHRRLLERIGKRPVLDLGMRLGEGSGAALAAQILKSAVSCHSGMATFEDAQVSESLKEQMTRR